MFPTDTQILCIDDTKTIHVLEQKFLTGMGFSNIITCSSVDQGIALLKSSPFGLIICDINMPEKNGIDFLKTIKGDNDLKNIPVVMLSIEKDMEVIKEVLALGAIGYILKPFTEESLKKGLSDAHANWTKN